MVSLPIAMDDDLALNPIAPDDSSEVETVDDWEVEAYDPDDELGCMQIEGEYADDTDQCDSAASTPKRVPSCAPLKRTTNKDKAQKFVIHPISYNSDDYFE